MSADEVLIVEATAQLNGYSGMLSIIADKVFTMEQAREDYARCLMLEWDSNTLAEKPQDFMSNLQEVIQPFAGGRCMLVVNYQSATEKASVQLGDAWRVHPTDELMDRLQRVFTQTDAVHVKYR